MMSNGNKRDPLELARQELDFAAIAATAPRCKDILYKAQTMVPMSPPRPWKRIATATAAVLLVCALIAVPWLPQQNNLVLMRVGFEKQFDQPAAQQLISHCLRELPGNALLGAKHDSSVGSLALRVSSVRHSQSQLQLALKNAIDSFPESLQSYNVQTGQISLTHWNSPFTLVKQLIVGKGGSARFVDDDLVAASVLANVEVIASGVREQLARADYELIGFSFITPDISSEATYDFTVDCWPFPVGVSIAQYEFLSTSAQLELQQRVADVLITANLRDTSLVLADSPTSWMPLMVDVCNAAGRHDERLTAQVQAWIEQPTVEEMNSIVFDPQDRLVEALQKVLPRYEYRIDYGQVSSSSATHQYQITVVITGRKAVASQERGRFGARVNTDDEDLEY